MDKRVNISQMVKITSAVFNQKYFFFVDFIKLSNRIKAHRHLKNILDDGFEEENYC